MGGQPNTILSTIPEVSLTNEEAKQTEHRVRNPKTAKRKA